MDESSDTTTQTRLELNQAIDIELVRIAQGTPGQAADGARTELLQRHAATVREQARRAIGCDATTAQREAQRGLHRAIRCFDPDRGGSFAEYATARVRAAVRNCGTRTSTVPATGMRQGRFLQVRITTSELAERLDRSPRLDELADEIGHDASEVLDALAVRSAQRVLTAQLAARLAEDDEQLVDLTEAISELDERTRLVLFRLERDQRSHRAIANELGISTFDVLDLERRGRQHIRRSTA